MKMKDRLTAVGIRVYDNSITIFGEAFFPRDLGSRQKQMAERLFICRSGLVERIDMLARDDQNMCRRLRRKIVERHANFILVDQC